MSSLPSARNSQRTLSQLETPIMATYVDLNMKCLLYLSEFKGKRDVLENLVNVPNLKCNEIRDLSCLPTDRYNEAKRRFQQLTCGST